ncbi:MAG: C45 family peptidase [Candidatus Margulisiibacteriota bacterium]
MKKIIVLFTVLLVLAGSLFLYLRAGERPKATFEGGAKYVYDYVPVVVLKGSWKEMGRQYGHLLSPNIRAVYDLVAPYQDKYNPGCDKTNAEIIEDFYQSYPDKFKQFFQGMAETSGLTLDQLKVANSLEIVLMFGSRIYQGRCSALGVWGKYSKKGRVVYGRNYDYNLEFLPLNEDIVVTVFKPNDGSVPAAICTWAGCLYASSGINQAGIFIEENDCSGHDRQAAGLYPTGKHFNVKNWVKDDALLLSLITSARSMNEVNTWMKKNLPIYPHNIGIADKNEARCYQWNITERVPHAPYVRQAEGLMAQTNHYFVVPKGWNLAPYKEVTDTGSTVPAGSIPRLDNLLKIANQRKGKIDVAGMCAIMDVDFDHGGATVDGSLYQIVCEPETFTFKLKTRAKRDRWVDIPVAKLLN